MGPLNSMGPDVDTQSGTTCTEHKVVGSPDCKPLLHPLRRSVWIPALQSFTDALLSRQRFMVAGHRLSACLSFFLPHFSEMLRSAATAFAAVRATTLPRRPAVEQSYAALSSFFRTQNKLLRQRSQWRREFGSAISFAGPAASIERQHPGYSVLVAPAPRHRTLCTSAKRSEPIDEAEIKKIEEKNTLDWSKSSSKTAAEPSDSAAHHDVHAHVSSFPRSLRRLAMSLPSSRLRRPTKEE